LAQVEDDVGPNDVLDGPRCKLEVVRLGAGRREVLDLDGRTADPFGGEGEGIERRDDGRPPVSAARAGTASRRQQGCHENENDSRNHAPEDTLSA